MGPVISPAAAIEANHDVSCPVYLPLSHQFAWCPSVTLYPKRRTERPLGSSASGVCQMRLTADACKASILLNGRHIAALPRRLALSLCMHAHTIAANLCSAAQLMVDFSFTAFHRHLAASPCSLQRAKLLGSWAGLPACKQGVGRPACALRESRLPAAEPSCQPKDQLMSLYRREHRLLALVAVCAALLLLAPSPAAGYDLLALQQ